MAVSFIYSNEPKWLGTLKKKKKRRHKVPPSHLSYLHVLFTILNGSGSSHYAIRRIKMRYVVFYAAMIKFILKVVNTLKL